MKSLLFTELASDFLIQGLGLHRHDNMNYIGKMGRHEVELVSAFDELNTRSEEIQIYYLGKAQGGPFRAGDILMAGSDDLLDRAFQALDEMDQRGVVVGLSPEAVPHQVSLQVEGLSSSVQAWKEKKIPYLCLFMVEPIESEENAKLVSLLRKVIG